MSDLKKKMILLWVGIGYQLLVCHSLGKITIWKTCWEALMMTNFPSAKHTHNGQLFMYVMLPLRYFYLPYR